MVAMIYISKDQKASNVVVTCGTHTETSYETDTLSTTASYVVEICDCGQFVAVVKNDIPPIEELAEDAIKEECEDEIIREILVGWPNGLELTIPINDRRLRRPRQQPGDYG